jgi:hypothetical protein
MSALRAMNVVPFPHAPGPAPNVATAWRREAPARPASQRAAAALDGSRPLLVVVRAGGLGGFLTAVPAYKALASAYPGHHRVLLASARLGSVVWLSGCFDELISTDVPVRLPHHLRGADVLVYLHEPGMTSDRMLRVAAPRRLVAFAKADAARSESGPRWRRHEHEVERWCRMLEGHGIPANPFHLDLPRPRRVRRDLRGATVIHPGSTVDVPPWPVDRWAAVARRVWGGGTNRVVVTGTRAERGRALAIARAAGLPIDAVRAGKTMLADLPGLIATAERVVCADTSIAHLATAMGAPSVVLFGSRSPLEWGPPAHRPWHRVLWHGPASASDSASALLEISVPEVLDAIASLSETESQCYEMLPCPA